MEQNRKWKWQRCEFEFDCESEREGQLESRQQTRHETDAFVESTLALSVESEIDFGTATHCEADALSDAFAFTVDVAVENAEDAIVGAEYAATAD